jgi:dCMP deaminase
MNTENNKVAENSRPHLKDKIYFETAKTISKLSRDERFKVGAVIVDSKGKVVSTGYNGPPSKFNDNVVDFSGEPFKIYFDPLDTKTITNMTKLLGQNEVASLIDFTGNIASISKEYKKGPFMLHAEMNAILTTDDRSRLENATIYVTHVPCDICAKLIAQTGISTVKTLNNKARRFKDFIFETLATFKESNINFEVFTEEELNLEE